MVKIIRSTIVFAMGLLFLISSHGSASARTITIPVKNMAPSDSTLKIGPSDKSGEARNSTETDKVRESIFKSKTGSLDKSHFTWGAEAGSSLDLTSHDLSTFDVDVLLGYKDSFVKLVGIGAGIHRSIHTGNNFIPVYGVFRTSFRRKPSLLFMNLQAGYSFNTISDSGTIGDFTGALGVGINLQQTRKAKSYIILSAVYQYFSKSNMDKIDIVDTNYIFFARLAVGVNF